MSFSLGGAVKTLEHLATEPFKAYSFRVVLTPDLSGGFLQAAVTAVTASLALGSFSSVEGIGWQTEVRTVREGGVNDREYKLPGLTTCNELRFTKGLTMLDPMWEWYRMTLKGKVRRMNGTIFLMSDLRTPKVAFLPTVGLPVAAWHFYHAWPKALEGVHFDASQSTIAIQHLTLAIERIEKIGLGSLF